MKSNTVYVYFILCNITSTCVHGWLTDSPPLCVVHMCNNHVCVYPHPDHVALLHFPECLVSFMWTPGILCLVAVEVPQLVEFWE